MSPHGIDKFTRWYLAGPMAGHPSFNYPLFDLVAARLRGEGYNIVSPAEMDSPESRRIIMASAHGDSVDLPPGTTWGKALARDIAALADGCEGIILLPYWWKSRGARLEATCGLLCDREFATWLPYAEVVQPFPAAGVKTRLVEWLAEA